MYQRCKNYKNRLGFDEVTDKIVGTRFYWTILYIAECVRNGHGHSQHSTQCSYLQSVLQQLVIIAFAAEVRAIVRYSYTAVNDDELTLTEGDIITVLDQNNVDAGWWKGELRGRVGVFPDNFAELLPACELDLAL